MPCVSSRRDAIPLEIVALWTLFLVVCIEILVAYTRTKPGELIGVPRTGLSVATTDAIGFLAFPTGLVAIGVALVVWDRFPRGAEWVVAGCALALGAVVFVPGVAEAEEVEVTLNPQRVVAAGAVLTLFVLTVRAARRHGVRGLRPRVAGDLPRLVLAAAIVFAALPWFAADLTLSLDRVPGLSRVFLTDVLRSEPARVGLNPAVHDGHHHGMDGALLALAAVALSRLVYALRGWRRGALAGLCGLLFAYGIANALEDFWLEQVVKRGASTYVFPKMLTPRASAAFAWILLAGAAVAVLILAVAKRQDARQKPPEASVEGRDGRPARGVR